MRKLSESFFAFQPKGLIYVQRRACLQMVFIFHFRFIEEPQVSLKHVERRSCLQLVMTFLFRFIDELEVSKKQWRQLKPMRAKNAVRSITGLRKEHKQTEALN